MSYVIEISMIKLGDFLGGQKMRIEDTLEIRGGDRTLVVEATQGNRLKITTREANE